MSFEIQHNIKFPKALVTQTKKGIEVAANMIGINNQLQLSYLKAYKASIV